MRGEADGGVTRCPGDDGCDRWRAAKGDTHEQKSQACLNCTRCDNNPPLENPAEDETDEVVDIVDRIAAIDSWEQAGLATDWSCYSFMEMWLYRVWRDAERDVNMLHTLRLQAVLKGYLKPADTP